MPPRLPARCPASPRRFVPDTPVREGRADESLSTMKDPAVALAARIEEFERAADPRLVLDEAALAEAEEAMLACTGGPRDAVVWQLIGALHLARYRLGTDEDEAAVAGVFFAAVAVLDPGGLPERLRGPHVPAAGSAETWAGLAEQVFRHVDVSAHPHVGHLVHAILRRALAEPTAEVCDRLGQALLEQALDIPEPAWAPEALALLGNGQVRLYRPTGDAGALDDAIHALFRAALADPGHMTDLAAALGHALPGDTDLIRAYLLAAGRPAGPERSSALLGLLRLTAARASASCADADLLALLRVGQACLDHWHEAGAHPAVLSCYGAGLLEWYAVPGDARSLGAGHDMLATLPSPAPAADPPPTVLPAPLSPETTPAISDSASGLSSAAAGEPDQLPGAGVEPSGGRWSAVDVALGRKLAAYAEPEWSSAAFVEPGWWVAEPQPGGHPDPDSAGTQTVPSPAWHVHPAASRTDDPALRLDLLGQRHWRRHRRTGDPADLELAIQTFRQAVVRAPEGHPDRPAFLADLAGALLPRATQTGDGGAAIATARAAADACPAHHPHRPRILLLLGRALSLNPSPRAADEAVTVLR